ncbi:hypothetical protein RD792_001200 [Penstemon davidsonii]|uniref:Growth-regulating factor n=1 Tax=Penstemon davidsonii TaxID=160366 RepID=A0ABR0DMS0_9LAMI|nr:hypothetical protein RD792_001200 [Penstemon davidsonii]
MKNEFWSCPGPNEPGNETGHHESTNLKHQRSGPKMPRRTSEVDFGRSNFWPSRNDDCQKMLSFSSYEPHCSSGMSIEFSMCQDELQRRTGVDSLGGLMRGRVKGPFTPSQWMELEHQALIYKHILSNVPVPSNLLVPLKRSLYSYGSSYASNFLGWGPFHLGSNDPEAGRCRRTDGKKWRCSRDAVQPDQKYCERHINRGRHRSRKPVEGQNGRVGSTTTTTTTTSKVEPPIASSSSLSVGANAMHNQFNSLQPNTKHLVTRTQGFESHPLIPSTLDPKSKDVPFSIQKQNIPPFEESSSYSSMFGLVSSDSLVNPSQTITYTNTKNPDSFLAFNDKEATVHHFIDDWPKDQPIRATGSSWPEELKSDWTQLSMSIPMDPDFSSSSISPQREKSTISTNELDPIHMTLDTSHSYEEKPIGKQSWVPVSWGNSMGGPLGEVLTSTSSSSPTGVLQKPTFVTLSNTSSGSSPNSSDSKKAHETTASVRFCGYSFSLGV